MTPPAMTERSAAGGGNRINRSALDEQYNSANKFDILPRPSHRFRDADKAASMPGENRPPRDAPQGDDHRLRHRRHGAAVTRRPDHRQRGTALHARQFLLELRRGSPGSTTSYITAAAIMTAPVGGLAEPLRSQASPCRLRARLHHHLDGICGAAQSTRPDRRFPRASRNVRRRPGAVVPGHLLDIYPPDRRGFAMAIWGDRRDARADHGANRRRLADRTRIAGDG